MDKSALLRLAAAFGLAATGDTPTTHSYSRSGGPVGRSQRSILSRWNQYRSKYTPHQGAREIERRRIGGFHTLHSEAK